MDIVKLQGTDKKLYEFVASLVMNPAVLRQNNNYPFKTGPKYIWYIAVEKDQTIGFIPVKKTPTDNCLIDNYYIKEDNETVLNKLLIEIIADKKNELWATVHKRHVKQFVQNGFLTHIEWKNYEKMLYRPKKKAICTD